MKKAFLTGATGFLGSHLVTLLQKRGYDLSAYAEDQEAMAALKRINVNPVSALDEMPPVDTVIHLAARVHQMHDSAEDPLVEFRKVNVGFALEVAQAALERGVHKFIFISSVKVYGNKAGSYTECSPLQPDDPYGISKYEAEQALTELFNRQSNAQLIILRLPMVYGPGNKGNMLPLLKTARKGVPLPVKGAQNKRSFLFIGNLVSAVTAVLEQTSGDKVQVYNVTDGQDISSCELYRTLSHHLSGKDGVFRLPRIFFTFGAALSPGARSIVSRLFDDYTFDSDKFTKMYHWKPPYTAKKGLEETARWYKTLSDTGREEACS